MDMTLLPGARHGAVRAPASKSQLHRLLLCAALGSREATIRRVGVLPKDIAATVDCLRALGAAVVLKGDAIRVTPISAVPDGALSLNCGESGSTLRFLLPVVGALGVEAAFHRAGRLPERPLAPLDNVLRAHGMEIWTNGADLCCKGKLLAEDYKIAGEVSSQFVTGLLYALPLLRGDSTLTVAGELVSAPYVTVTGGALRQAGITFTKDGNRYTIPGGQRYALPEETLAEGDWSSAAAFLCMGALSREGVTVAGLTLDSTQGDRAVLDILRRFGAGVEATAEAVTVRRGTLLGGVIDAADIPDLVPVLAAVASVAGGETRIVNAARLRDKESDRLRATAAMLNALGADVAETPDGLVIRGRGKLAGGTADAANDHRVAMAAAVAAGACMREVTITGAECVDKSYPMFWEEPIWRSM